MKETIKSIVYKTLDVATNGRGISRNIGGENVRFPVSYFRYYPSNYEPDLFKFLRKHCEKGDVFLDCGAHIGLFSVVASHLVGENGRIVSFEPTPSIRKILQDVVAINECKNVEVRPEALSQKSGTAEFFDTGIEGSNANSLVKLGKHKNSLTVPTISIDEVVFHHNLKVKCMKIDVEGAEFDVLVGAEKTIKTQKPAIFLSLHPNAVNQMGSSLNDIWNILESHQLTVKHLENPVGKEWFIKQTDLFDVECLP